MQFPKFNSLWIQFQKFVDETLCLVGNVLIAYLRTGVRVHKLSFGNGQQRLRLSVLKKRGQASQPV